MDEDKERKEKMILDEFKKRMKDYMESEMYEDDHLFYRFLKARDFKIDDAEAMLRKHLEWRKQYDIKNILKWKPPEVLEKYFPLFMLGYDKEGCIVKYNPFGTTDFRGLLEACKEEAYLKRLIQCFEEDLQELKKQSEKLGRRVDKVLYIENMEHFSLSKATDKRILSHMIVSTNMYMDNYPETLKASYVINAPVYFSIFFSVLKVFLPNTILKKIKVYSDDSWKKDLLEIIDAEVLPAFLGGKRTDPDGNPLCLTLINDAGNVPEKYYLNKSKSSFPSLTDAKKVTISRASVHEVQLEVKEPGSHLEWEFELKSGDIKFGLFYKGNDEEKREILPLQKITSKGYAENGLYKCENTGSYTIVFDNTHNLFKTKEICYKLNLKNSEEQAPN